MFGFNHGRVVSGAVAFFALNAVVQSAVATAGVAWDDRVDTLNKGVKVGYEIWYNDFGWMLRTTSIQGQPAVRFTGRIQVTNGKFVELSSGGADKVDKYRLSADKDTITFDFQTAGGIDGINFRCSKGSTYVLFSLDINGRTVTNRILIGSKTVPETNPFALPAFPKKN